MTSEAPTLGTGEGAPVSLNERKLAPSASRELLQREAAGVETTAQMVRGSAVSQYLNQSRGESLVDRSTRAASAIAEIRDERLANLRVDKLLSETIAGILRNRSAPEGTLMAAPAPSLIVNLREAVKAFVQRAINGPTQRPSRAQQQSLDTHEADTKAVTKKTTSPDEEEESTLTPRPKSLRDRALGVLSQGFRSLVSGFGEFLVFAKKLCGDAIAALSRLFRKPEPPLPTTFKPYESDSASPVLHEQGRKVSESLPVDWFSRFGDDPAEEVKSLAKSIESILEDLARRKREEEKNEALATKEQEERERDRLNCLREQLAKLITPLNDGTIPAILLSRHYVGPWVTTEDLTRAIAEARQAKAEVSSRA